jgi:predicted phage terminase large subunit-like protein
VLGDWREVGEALVPERFGVDDLEAIKQRSGSYFWSSLYQQRPTPREGNMFKRAWFDIVSNVPGRGRFVRYWDKAGTTDGGDYTAGILMAVVDGTYYVVDLVMGQWAAGERERVIRQTAFTDQKRFGDVEIGVEQEPGSSGKESAENTIRNLPGFRVYADRPTGDKELRAEPLAAQAEINNVKIVDGDWNARYLDIITAFPTGSIDDPVDASSGAFARLVKDYKVKVRSYV